MFLRKLTVLLVPLVLLGLVCLLLPLMGGIGFWGNVLKGGLLGLGLGLLLPLSGATRRREPFGALLWLPALLTVAVIVCQYLLSTGVRIPVVSVLATSDGQIVLAEAAFAAFMLAECIRTAR